MTKSNNSQRMFIGLPLDEEGKRGVGAVVKQLQKKHWKVRWEPPEKWHTTLVFLGDKLRNEETEEQISRIIRNVALNQVAFKVTFKGVDVFPKQELGAQYGERWHGRSMRRLWLRQKPTIVLPKLIYVRLGGELKAMHKLVASIRKGLIAEGTDYDKKPFVPHLTIGRISKDCGRAERIEIGKTIGKLYNLEIPHNWLVERVCVYESELLPEGSRYKVVDEVKLVSRD